MRKAVRKAEGGETGRQAGRQGERERVKERREGGIGGPEKRERREGQRREGTAMEH